MVLKRTKDGLANTGNTLRTKHTKYYRNLIRHGLIIKESGVSARPKFNPSRDRKAITKYFSKHAHLNHDSDEFCCDQPSKKDAESDHTSQHEPYVKLSYLDRLLDPDTYCCESCDLFTDANILDDVPYSTNKMGRWKLVEQIKGVILNEITCSTVLLETCTIFKSNRTESFRASNRNNEFFIWPCGFGLVNEESIWKDYLNIEPRIDTKIQILKPFEDGGCVRNVSYNHKIIGFNQVKKIKPRDNRASRVHRKSNIKNLLNDELDKDGYIVDYKVKEAKNAVNTTKSDKEKLGFNFVGSKFKSKRRKRKNNKNRKDVKSELRNEQIDKQSQDSRMDPVSVLIPCQDVLPACLQQNYGDDYIECQCYPRRFLINVTERLEYHMMTSGCWKGKNINTFNLDSCVVFVEDLDSNKDSKLEGFSKFKVNFNIQTRNDMNRILTLSDKFRGGISDIIQKTLYYINLVSESEMTTNDLYIRNSEMKVDQPFKLLNMFLRVDVKYDATSTKSLFRDIFNGVGSKQSYTSNSCVFKLPSTCAICLNDCHGDGTKCRLLMMTSCHHAFCEPCWLQYINCQLNTGRVAITCPYFGCSEVVPDTLLLTFISVNKVSHLAKRRKEFAMFSSGNMKWCPNHKCSRPLRVTNSTEAASISCPCGVSFCFNCLTNAHWPLSCHYTSVYRQKLKGSKVDQSKKSHVNDRPGFCPRCSIPMERIGSGIFMTCICGTQFCWGCLHVYPNHKLSKECFAEKTKKAEDKRLQTKIRSNNRDKSTKSQYFKMALSHRVISKNQNSFSKLKSAIMNIIMQCKNMPLKRCPSFLTIITRFDESERKRTNSLVIKDRISGALWELLNIYRDFHHIAEYSLILMDELRETKNDVSTVHLPSHINQLNLYAENIASLIQSSDELTDYRLLIETLLALEKQCQKQIQQFISVIRKLK